MSTEILSPFPIFADLDGEPLEAGYIWIGVENLPPQTNPKTVYADPALTIPVAQPIRTQQGFAVANGTPTILYGSGNYSVLVQNKTGQLVYSRASVQVDGTITTSDLADGAVTIVKGGHGSTTAAGGRKALGSRFLRLEDYGGGVGVANNTPALNALAADAPAQGIYTLELDVGTYGFTSKPNDFTIGLQIIGAGISLSGLKRNYSAGSNDEGFLTWTHAANGGGFSHVSIVAGNNSTGGTMVKFRAPASGQGASYCVADDFFLSYDTGSSYHRALFVDGVGNNLVGGQGLRDLRLSRAFIFKPLSGSGTYLIEVRNAVNHQWSDLWTNGALLISGGGTTETNTTVFNLTNGTVFGELYVENSSGVLISNLRAAANAIFAATTTEGMFVGSIATGLSNFSSSFLVLDRAYSLARNLSASGFLNLPNGLKIQWFVATVTTSFATVTFPSAFSTALVNVQATPVSIQTTIAVQAGTTTGVDIASASGPISAYIFAVGY